MVFYLNCDKIVAFSCDILQNQVTETEHNSIEGQCTLFIALVTIFMCIIKMHFCCFFVEKSPVMAATLYMYLLLLALLILSIGNLRTFVVIKNYLQLR